MVAYRSVPQIKDPRFRDPDSLRLPLGSVYRPRWAATLTVPVAGSRAERIQQAKSETVLTLEVRPKSVRIERNDHNQADTCALELDWTEAGVDSRVLDDATVEVHIANADDDGLWTPSPATVRFAGIVKEVQSSRDNEEAASVRLECVDYTALFLAAKPFGSKGVPQFNQRIGEAWQTIVSQTPGADIFADPKRLILQDVDPSLVVGKGVAERFQKVGKLQTKPETDAWAVWQQCVGMLGLISYIDQDRCVVSTATNYYTEQDAPKMIWGRNIKTWHESRLSALVKKGIGITSFDPLTLRTLEAFYPPIGDERVKRARAAAKKLLSEDKIRQREDRDYFSYSGVTDLGTLENIARRVWEERSRQELEGAITTEEMWTATEGGAMFDLLDLRAGDTVRVEIAPGERQLLSSLGSDADRLAYLADRGYTEDAANLIVSNMKNFADLHARFLTKNVQIDVESDETGGSFNVQISYVNRIQITGDTE